MPIISVFLGDRLVAKRDKVYIHSPMKDVNKCAKVLGFSELETAVFGALACGEFGISDLARQTGRSHSSLYRPLQALKKRGVVEMRRVGNRARWRRTDSDEILSSLGSTLFPNQSHPEFFLLSGEEALKKIYYTATEQRGVRILGIQPNKSIQSILSIFPSKEIVDINMRIKKRGIIMEAILQENIISSYAESLKQKAIDPKEIFHSFSGRAADTTYVPKEFLNFDSEIIIMPKVAYIVNWGRMVGVEVRNKETIGLLREIFALAKHFGRKVNLNEIVERQINADHQSLYSPTSPRGR